MNISSLFWPALVLGLVFNPAHSATTAFIYSQNEHCPAGFRLGTLPSQAIQRQAMCDQMSPWDIAKLAHQGSISGSGYGCTVKQHDTRSLGHAICTPVDIIISQDDTCPVNYNLITPAEVADNTSKYCDMLAPTSAVRLGDNTSLSGIAGHCEMHDLTINADETHELGASLCGLASRIKTWSDCPNGTELLQGSNTPNYCIPLDAVASNSRWDHLGTDMCQNAGKGDFVELRRVFTDRQQRINPQVLDKNAQPVTLAAGIPTLICDEKPLPTYSSSGHIAACPLGTELVKGQSAPEHCAYIWGEAGLDNLDNEVCAAFGGFDTYIYRVPRAPKPLAYQVYSNPLIAEGEVGHTATVYPDGQRLALCQQETPPETDANGTVIKCPSYSELILSASAGNHCALLGGDPGYDINNDQDVCRKAGKGDFVRYLTNTQGQKILVCENETQAIAEAIKLVQTLNCPTGEEFIKSSSIQPNVYDHCAIIGEDAGLDSQGKDVCLASGMAGFKDYGYPGGVKTLYCQCPADNSGCNDSGDATRATSSGGDVSIH
ncbi:hypothetical protein Sden_1701 [Shewanella denitrificans OS217]|uniref:Uncharacterized protein n=1 Tax=Shewanella denitrificans (strain OS217 / ATCC BAA-1090 / DSM 15013) TaxID=318161 RepID=Q12NJ1_SHEDO|nr:hypothetical protein [Shewanella denitrificans]ABE54985.1 hypothetical protein Sden_1701 [Shewanella denitrificans OS217]